MTTQFSSPLEALGATIQSALAEGENQRLDEAKDRAASLRKLLEAMARLDGRSATPAKLKTSFEACAELFLCIQTGNQVGAIPKMQASLKALQDDVAKARAEASENFDTGVVRADAAAKGNQLVGSATASPAAASSLELHARTLQTSVSTFKLSSQSPRQSYKEARQPRVGGLFL